MHQRLGGSTLALWDGNRREGFFHLGLLKGDFIRVPVTVIDRYHGDAGNELVILGNIVCAVCDRAAFVSLSGVSLILIEYYKSYFGS